MVKPYPIFKVVIAGSRAEINGIKTGIVYGDCKIAMQLSGWKDKISHVISGCSPSGGDFFGERWATEETLRRQLIGLPPIYLIHIPAMWDELGKKAGYERNERMAKLADALIAIWDGKSKGTKHMIDCMREMKKEYFVYNFKSEQPEFHW